MKSIIHRLLISRSFKQSEGCRCQKFVQSKFCSTTSESTLLTGFAIPNIPPPPPTSSASASNPDVPVSVKAYFIAQSIDLHNINNILYKTQKKYRPETKSVTVEIDKNLNQYVSVFNYGSVVLFNIPTEQHVTHLKKIRESAILTPIPINEEKHYTEQYNIRINPGLEKSSVIKAEHVNIRNLDDKNIAIIGSVIAHSVALDYYYKTVNKMLESFMKMNLKIEETGSFKDLNMPQTYKLVASNNRIVATALSKLGIFEGCDAAWDNADYHDTWNDLRLDFEIDSRYKDLSLKLDLVQENGKFIVQILQNEKSTRMEQIIIFLIAFEVFLGLANLSDCKVWVSNFVHSIHH